MFELVLSGFLLFRGAGPGSAGQYPYHGLPAAGGTVVSQQVPGTSELLFLRPSRRGESVIGVRDFGKRRQTLVEISRDGMVRELGAVEDNALLYPVLSPDRRWLAALVIPGRIDLPPTGDNSARLVVCLLPPPVEIGKPAPLLSGFREMASNLPVIPPDWAADGKSLYFVTRGPAGEVVMHIETGNSITREVGAGVFPRASPDGQHVAHIRDRNVVITRLDGTQVHVEKTVWAVGWLAWSPNGEALAIAESGPGLRSRLSVLQLPERLRTSVLESGPVKDLLWLSGPPAWREFSAH